MPRELARKYVAGPQAGPLFEMPAGLEPTASWFNDILGDTVSAAGLSSLNDILRDTVSAAGLFSLNIKSHSFRIGRVCDMAIDGYSSDSIRLAGRWRSEAFRNYLRVDAVKM